VRGQRREKRKEKKRSLGRAHTRARASSYYFQLSSRLVPARPTQWEGGEERAEKRPGLPSDEIRGKETGRRSAGHLSRLPPASWSTREGTGKKRRGKGGCAWTGRRDQDEKGKKKRASGRDILSVEHLCFTALSAAPGKEKSGAHPAAKQKQKKKKKRVSDPR